MAYSRTWDAAYEATPAGAAALSGGDDRIRDQKTDIRERMEKDHYMALAGTDADHGEHKKVTLHEPISTPGNVANKGFVYGKDVGAKIELFYLDEDGNEIQLTTAGKLKTGRSAFIETLIDDANAVAARVTLEALGVDFPEIWAGTSGQNTYAANLSPALTSYVAGTIYFITFNLANTAATPSINLNGLGARTIRKYGQAAVQIGDIPQYHVGILHYTGANFILLNPKAHMSYSSPTQTITAGGLITLAHGLGADPDILRFIFRCTTGDCGYAVGEKIIHFPTQSRLGENRGLSVRVDATNIKIRFGSEADTVIAIPRADTGVACGLLNTSWDMNVKAWRF
jgi:hypothetical protein